MARLPRIRALNLLPPSDPWDWPEFPAHVQMFIETGVLYSPDKVVYTVAPTRAQTEIAYAKFVRDVRRMTGKPVSVESLLTDEDFEVMKLED